MGMDEEKWSGTASDGPAVRMASTNNRLMSIARERPVLEFVLLLIIPNIGLLLVFDGF